MVEFLRKTFIKDYQNIKDPSVRKAHGKLASLVGVISNCFLFCVKLVIGLISGSIAMIADGINNLSDMGSSVITLVGFKLASAPADKEHPYGHQRIEYIAGLIVSMIIIFVGGNLFFSSFNKIIHYEMESVSNTVLWISIGILSLSILVKMWQSYFNKKIGNLLQSVALCATAEDSRNDCIATFTILLADIVLLFWKNIPFSLDGVMGILVSLFILYSGIGLIKETVDPLIGVQVDKAFVKEIVTEIKKDPFVLGVHDIVCHLYGPTKCFMTIHVEVDANQKLLEIHDVIDNLEKKIRLEYQVELTIHMDPIQTDNPEVNQLRGRIKQALEEIDEHLSMHDFRVVEGPSHTNLIFDLVVPYRFTRSNEEIVKLLQEKIQDEGKTYYFVIEFDQQFVQNDDLNDEYGN